jgi:RNA polymerase sigma-70 factor (ECF subfamily)
LSSFFDQDRSTWDRELLAEGLKFLELSATGPVLGDYHVQAAIAAVHANAQRAEDIDWHAIVSLYDTLMNVAPSPIVALNRAIAIGESAGPERALQEMAAIADGERLAGYPFYSAALGEFELRRGNYEIARGHFQAALALARNPMESRFLERRVQACDRPSLNHSTGK